MKYLWIPVTLLVVVGVIGFAVMNSAVHPPANLSNEIGNLPEGQRPASPPRVDEPPAASAPAETPAGPPEEAETVQPETSEAPQPAESPAVDAEPAPDPAADDRNELITLVAPWEYRNYGQVGGSEFALIKTATDAEKLDRFTENQVTSDGVTIADIGPDAVKLAYKDATFDLRLVREPVLPASVEDMNRPLTEREKRDLDEYMQRTYFDKIRQLTIKNEPIELLPHNHPDRLAESGGGQPDGMGVSGGAAAPAPAGETAEGMAAIMREQMENPEAERANQLRMVERDILPEMNSVEEFQTYWAAFHPGEEMPEVTVTNFVNSAGEAEKRLILLQPPSEG